MSLMEMASGMLPDCGRHQGSHHEESINYVVTFSHYELNIMLYTESGTTAIHCTVEIVHSGSSWQRSRKQKEIMGTADSDSHSICLFKTMPFAQLILIPLPKNTDHKGKSQALSNDGPDKLIMKKDCFHMLSHLGWTYQI